MKQATLLISRERGLDDPELRFIFDVLHSHLINFEIEARLNDQCIMHIKYGEIIRGQAYEGFMGFTDDGKLRLMVYYGNNPERFEETPMEDAGVAIAHSILKNDYRCRHCVVNTREKLSK